MLYFLLLLLLALSLLLEMTVQADLRHGADTRLRLILRVAGIHRTWRLIRPAHSPQVLLATAHGVHPLSREGITPGLERKLLSLLRRADRTRHFLLQHVHLNRLDALLRLHTQDAARTALITGALRSVVQLPAVTRRHIRIRVVPDFLGAHSSAMARCIIRVRLGTILLTAMMLLAAYLRQQHLTESEAM